MTVWSSYQGVEVADIQPDVPVRHPRWGYDKPARLSGASLLMLADGILLVVCNECGYNGLTGSDPYVKPEGDHKSIIKQADSLLSHINGKHHPSKADRRTSRYTDDQIKVAIKIWLKWRNTRVKNWTQAACDEIGRLGFKPSYAEQWSPDQLGSLVRSYMNRPEFKNVRPAPMNDSDRDAIAAMVRDAAAREGNQNSVAANARITQTRPRGTRIDYDQIVKDSEAVKNERQNEEATVATHAPTPTLNFVSTNGGSEPTPTRVLVMTEPEPEPGSEPVVPDQRRAVVLPPVGAGNYEHLLDLDGTPVFRYKGVLMAGKPVKGIEV